MPERAPIIHGDHFPFGPEFQKVFLRILLEDSDFAFQLDPHLQPAYFSVPALQWAWAFSQSYRKEYERFPTLMFLADATQRIEDPATRDVYAIVMEQTRVVSMGEQAAVRGLALTFVKRNLFARGHHEWTDAFNAGHADEALDIVRRQIEEIDRVGWQGADEAFFFDSVRERHATRLAYDPNQEMIPTGINFVDRILRGGLSLGEMGVWMAYAKKGKTTMLVNHGVAATRIAGRRTAHMIFEGSRQLVQDRYDAAFMKESYDAIRLGNYSDDTFQRMQYEYKQMQGLLVLSSYVDNWDNSVLTIDEALRRYERRLKWRPECLLVDYGDLINGRNPPYRSEHEKQKAAFRDLKTLASRGYALWTASQAQRPERDSESKPHILKSRQIADCYDKVRVCDFMGSLNQTDAEAEANQMRVHAELYRDAAANVTQTVRAQLDQMIICEDHAVTPIHGDGDDLPPSIGPQQMRMVQ